MTTTENEELWRILFPHAYRQICRVKNGRVRFVHYTDAHAATSILKNKKVWMRNASCMNDFMEIDHGLNCLAKAYRNSKAGENFRTALNSQFPNITEEITKLFDAWQDDLRDNTYIACFSEHRIEEDLIGRLSMWRGYGYANGIAFVMNNTAFLSESDALNVYTSPVAYFDDHQFAEGLQEVSDNILKSVEFLSKIKRDEMIAWVFHMFKMTALCTKHKGFEEEKEWRVIYNPNYVKSEHLTKDIEIIKGMPQTVYKAPLKNVSEKGLTGLDLSELIDRIIIGPTDFPFAARDAFIHLLEEAEVENAREKVIISDIPLRR